MTDETTALDAARLAMAAQPESDAGRLRFYERLADSELFLLLERESDGESIEPEVFPTEDGPVVLVFDRERRLADFLGRPAHFAGLSGRQVVRLLQGQGLGLGVNLGTPEAAIILPATALDWLAEMLDHHPQEAEEHPREVTAPESIPEAVLTGLDAKLASAGGLADCAYLVGVTYRSGRATHLLAFIEAAPGAETALAKAAGEALAFSGVEAGELDVAFFRTGDPVAAKLAKVGLRFDLPVPEQPQIAEITAPGMDPNDPPILH